MKNIRKTIREGIANAKSIQDLKQLVYEVEEYDRVQGTTSWRDDMLKASSRFRFRTKEAELTRKELGKITSLEEAAKFYYFILPEWSNYFTDCAKKVASYYSDVLKAMEAHDETQASPLKEALLKRWNELVIEQMSKAESFGELEKLYPLAPPGSEAQGAIVEKWEQMVQKTEAEQVAQKAH